MLLYRMIWKQRRSECFYIAWKKNAINAINAISKHSTTLHLDALRSSGYTESLSYIENLPKKTRNRKRNIILFNPPYSKNVATNTGKSFLKLIDKNFPKGSLTTRRFYPRKKANKVTRVSHAIAGRITPALCKVSVWPPASSTRQKWKQPTRTTPNFTSVSQNYLSKLDIMSTSSHSGTRNIKEDC